MSRSGKSGGVVTAHGSKQELERDVTLKVCGAIREIRRGASMQKLHQMVYGSGSDALDLGLTDTLHFVVEFGSARVNALGGALRVDPSTVTRSIERLEQLGLVERVMDPEDRRAVRVIPTVEGLRRHELFEDLTLSAWKVILNTFSTDEQRTLTELLSRLVDRLSLAAKDSGLRK